MNYGEIKNLVARFTHRSDLVGDFDSIFELVRERISKDARLIVMEMTLVPVVTDNFFPLPVDFLEMISLTAGLEGGNRPMKFYPKKQLDNLKHQRTGAFGFTIQGNQVEVQTGPAPLSLVYYARPAVLVSDADTNPVLTTWPSLYLYAAMSYATNLMQDTESEMVSRQNYAAELDQANESDQAGRTMGGGLKIVGG